MATAAGQHPQVASLNLGRGEFPHADNKLLPPLPPAAFFFVFFYNIRERSLVKRLTRFTAQLLASGTIVQQLTLGVCLDELKLSVKL